MKNIQILDCTLRDGGRIIDCAFPDREITQIVRKLEKAKIDIIEIGFLRDWRDVQYSGDSTFFTDVDQIVPLINQNGEKSPNSTYVAFIDFGMFDFASLKPYDGKSVDGLRVGFTKNDYLNNRAEIIQNVRHVKNLGYKLFIQGVNSLNYSDKQLLEILEMVNEIQPNGYGVVDTYGAMYIDDVVRLYTLVDHNLDKNIAIDFHSHNNFQLSFSFAQEIVRLSKSERNVIIDATLNGMGKEAGNLNTELIADYLARQLGYDYDLDYILDAIDEHLHEINRRHRWGYSLSSMMSGIYKSHPNNVIYLMEKFRLDSKDIKNILFMLDEKERQTYNYAKIDELYRNYNTAKYDDTAELAQLKQLVQNRPVLVLAPGKTISTHKRQIDEYIQANNPVIISVGFAADYDSLLFIANKKRYANLKTTKTTIATSNIAQKQPNEIIVNYFSLLNHENKWFDNSVMMLLNLLRKISATSIAIAGMDGFSSDVANNYAEPYLPSERLAAQYTDINAEVADMLHNYTKIVSETCKITFITPSLYDKANKSDKSDSWGIAK
ncbi:MAG: aldolase catalytic domain-containing protein [Defluviitaleaceae bacterium]|nr:aldolase catalytic domain-containing protein [Defluviitaleaceae bacterium]